MPIRFPAWLLCSLTAAMFGFAAADVRSDEVIDRVLAVVAGEVLMSSDVRAARELGLVDPGNAPDPDRAVLMRLIDRSLMLDEVNRYAPPEPEGAAIELAARRIADRFASDGDFSKALARSGLDERQLREILRQDLRIQSYLDQRFRADTPEHVQAAIDEWLTGLRRRGEVVDLYGSAPR